MAKLECSQRPDYGSFGNRLIGSVREGKLREMVKWITWLCGAEAITSHSRLNHMGINEERTLRGLIYKQ